VKFTSEQENNEGDRQGDTMGPLGKGISGGAWGFPRIKKISSEAGMSISIAVQKKNLRGEGKVKRRIVR